MKYITLLFRSLAITLLAAALLVNVYAYDIPWVLVLSAVLAVNVYFFVNEDAGGTP